MNLLRTVTLSCFFALCPAVFASKQDELNLARQIWKSYNMKQYYFGLEVPYTTDPNSIPKSPTQFGVSVQNGTISDVVNDHIHVDDMMKRTVPTVEGIFDLIQQAIDHPEIPWIDVTYNLDFGYPEKFDIIYPPPLNNNTSSENNNSGEIVPIIVDPTTEVGAIIAGNIIEFTPTTFLLENLLASKAAWSTLQCTDYDMIYQRHQYVPPPFSSRLQIQVRGGVATKAFIVSQENNTIINDVTDVFGTNIPTVDKLYDELETILSAAGPAKAIINYDTKLNYPSSASIDINKILPGEEFAFDIFQLAPIIDRQQQLNDARTKWNSLFGISNGTDSSYSFTYQPSCIGCAESDFTQPRWVRVKNSQVVTVHDAHGDVVSPAVFLDTPSIEDIFTKIQDAIDNTAFSLEVTYDDKYGYPSQVTIDPDENIADDEVLLSISSLLPVSLLESEVSINKAMWNSMAYSHYSYSYLKYCLACPNKEVFVEVKNGEIVSVDGVAVVPPSTGSPAANGTAANSLPPTIDDLFVTIEKALSENVFDVSVSYDSFDGFPTDIYIDYIELIKDEELIVIVSGLAVVVN